MSSELSFLYSFHKKLQNCFFLKKPDKSFSTSTPNVKGKCLKSEIKVSPVRESHTHENVPFFQNKHPQKQTRSLDAVFSDANRFKDLQTNKPRHQKTFTIADVMTPKITKKRAVTKTIKVCDSTNLQNPKTTQNYVYKTTKDNLTHHITTFSSDITSTQHFPHLSSQQFNISLSTKEPNHHRNQSPLNKGFLYSITESQKVVTTKLHPTTTTTHLTTSTTNQSTKVTLKPTTIPMHQTASTHEQQITTLHQTTAQTSSPQQMTGTMPHTITPSTYPTTKRPPQTTNTTTTLPATPPHKQHKLKTSQLFKMAEEYVHIITRCGMLTEGMLLMIQLCVTTDWDLKAFGDDEDDDVGDDNSRSGDSNDLKWRFTDPQEIITFSSAVLNALSSWLSPLQSSSREYIYHIINNNVNNNNNNKKNNGRLDLQLYNPTHSKRGGALVSFDAEVHTRGCFPNDSSFHVFMGLRDSFCKLLTDSNINKQAVVRDIMVGCQHNIAVQSHFINFFLSHLLKSSGAPTEIDDVIMLHADRHKLSKLQERLGSSSSDQDIFFFFLLTCNNYNFISNLTSVVLLRIKQKSARANEEVMEAINNKNNLSSTFAEDFSREVVALRKLGNLLGFIQFMPYHHHQQDKYQSFNSTHNKFNCPRNTNYNQRNNTFNVASTENVLKVDSGKENNNNSSNNNSMNTNSDIFQQMIEARSERNDIEKIMLILKGLFCVENSSNKKKKKSINNDTKNSNNNGNLVVVLCWCVAYLSHMDVCAVYVNQIKECLCDLVSLHRHLLARKHTYTSTKLSILLLEGLFMSDVFPRCIWSEKTKQLTQLQALEWDMHDLVLRECCHHFYDKAQDIIRKSSINQNNNKNNELEVKKTDGKARKIVPLRMVEDSDNVNINKISNNISKNNINNNNNDNNNNKDNNDNVNKNSEDERKGSDIQAALLCGFFQLHSSSFHRTVDFVCERVFASWCLCFQTEVQMAQRMEMKGMVVDVVKGVNVDNFQLLPEKLSNSLSTIYNLQPIIASLLECLLKIRDVIGLLLPPTTVPSVLSLAVLISCRACVFKVKNWVKDNASFVVQLREMVAEANKHLQNKSDLMLNRLVNLDYDHLLQHTLHLPLLPPLPPPPPPPSPSSLFHQQDISLNHLISSIQYQDTIPNIQTTSKPITPHTHTAEATATTKNKITSASTNIKTSTIINKTAQGTYPSDTMLNFSTTTTTVMVHSTTSNTQITTQSTSTNPRQLTIQHTATQPPPPTTTVFQYEQAFFDSFQHLIHYIYPNNNNDMNLNNQKNNKNVNNKNNNVNNKKELKVFEVLSSLQDELLMTCVDYDNNHIFQNNNVNIVEDNINNKNNNDNGESFDLFLAQSYAQQNSESLLPEVKHKLSELADEVRRRKRKATMGC